MEVVTPNLKIDVEFQKLLAPLSDEEFKQLEGNILRDGCREPLTVWHTILIDGHNRYAICKKHGIQFTTRKVTLRNREEVIAWICANQLGRRNISEGTRKYLIGKRYEMEKLLGVHNASGRNQYSSEKARSTLLTEPVKYDASSVRTRERLGKEYCISHATVSKYNMYSRAMDQLSLIAPKLVATIMSDRIKISHENIVALSKMTESEIAEVADSLMEKADTVTSFVNARHELGEKLHPIVPKRLPDNSVKNMPEYDPDAEIASLVYTIPSWVSSMHRVMETQKVREASVGARNNLTNKLSDLKQMIEVLVAALAEE